MMNIAITVLFLLFLFSPILIGDTRFHAKKDLSGDNKRTIFVVVKVFAAAATIVVYTLQSLFKV